MLNHGEYHKIRSMVRMFILTKGGRLFFFMGSISTQRPKKDSETAKKDSKTAKNKTKRNKIALVRIEPGTSYWKLQSLTTGLNIILRNDNFSLNL